MKAKEKKLLSKAVDILEKNWRGKYTVPSLNLYPHQWSWDSAFISIGNSHINQNRAQKELLSLFEGQWRNGMLPHIVFSSKGNYFPNPEYWQTGLSENSPKIKTSGITQPAVHAISALYIYNNAEDKKNAKKFLKKIYPKIINFHRYLLTKRDPENSGLITIFHQWESGFDNSVRWDEALARVRVKDLPKYKRIDTKKVKPEQRPTKEAYDKYMYLVEIMKKHNYNEEDFYEKIPFKIKDIVFSSILHAANKTLLDIANIIGESTTEIKNWMRKTSKNYFGYYCSKNKAKCLVYDFDLVANKRIEKRTVASLIPIYAGLLNKKHAEDTISFMNHAHFCKENCIHKHPVVTSMSVHESEFNLLNYWRGPVWININWMLYNGLKNYGFYEEAKTLKNAIIELVTEHGFYEYYNPSSGDGLGTNEFSWTAALVIDLLSENK